jgi:hypothetical protein
MVGRQFWVLSGTEIYRPVDLIIFPYALSLFPEVTKLYHAAIGSRIEQESGKGGLEI